MGGVTFWVARRDWRDQDWGWEAARVVVRLGLKVCLVRPHGLLNHRDAINVSIRLGAGCGGLGPAVTQ